MAIHFETTEEHRGTQCGEAANNKIQAQKSNKLQISIVKRPNPGQPLDHATRFGDWKLVIGIYLEFRVCDLKILVGKT